MKALVTAPGGLAALAADLDLNLSAANPELISALEATLGVSPYLERTARRRPAALAQVLTNGPQAVVAAACSAAETAASMPLADAMAALRQAKADLHLAVALVDLAGLWDVNAVTAALSEFADTATRSALAIAATDLFGEPIPGFFILAMGKHGGRELNYSSDIDLTAFFDRDLLPERFGDTAQRAMTKLISLVARILEEITADGYVFRVDLRLRPDPGSTQPAVSVQAAESYYESFGQNWERAVFIKARPVAGDLAAAEAFLADLQPFIWRKHLDFAAIADVQSIMAQIHAHGRHGDLRDADFDVKLGRGGIRAIEFFVQTQQLILGGRDRSLRVQRTEEGLHALQAAGRIAPEVVADLIDAYRFLRGVEHRIQMREDAQTHRVPTDPIARRHIAALAGFDTLDAFEERLLKVRQTVLARIAELFPEGQSLAAPVGSLVFTGVDDDPETLDTLAAMGFGEPGRVAETIRGWHFGRVRATRTPRARELLTALIPDLLAAMAATGEPDAAFKRFAAFFAGLTAGVQILSLFRAERELLRETVEILALAPRFGDVLARQPALIDSMIETRFGQALDRDAPGERLATIQTALAPGSGFEEALDLARRVHREEAFRIAFQTLQGRADASVAGDAFADLADSMITALLPVALTEVERRHGTLSCRWAVCGWGKLGGRELAAESDLDLMIVYDPQEETSDGARPLEAEQYATRVTQRLIAALSAPTAEGGLYEVDMQLRPSGKAGPVAVRLSSLGPYYDREAWTWERMALTRLRPVAGDPELMAAIQDLKCGILCRPGDADKVRADVVDMRDRLERERPGGGLWDLKLSPGGLVDLEFIVQTLILIHAPSQATVVQANTLAAVNALIAAGELDPETGGRLTRAGRLLSDLRQVLGLAVQGIFDPTTAPTGLKRRLCAVAHAPDFSTLEALLADTKAGVRSLLHCHVGVATGTATDGV